MISYLKGTVIAQGPDYIITETKGVGYRVYVAKGHLLSLPVGSETELYCYLRMRREETLELYGVESAQALEVFETANNISGIGPRAALAIASLGTMEQLKEAVEKGDANYFSTVHGIGKKKIQKIILELTGKLKNLEQKDVKTPEEKEAIAALVSLGFSRQQASQALGAVPKEITSLEEKVKQALKIARR
jgi:holliday junction DNA helicase RuvA